MVMNLMNTKFVHKLESKLIKGGIKFSVEPFDAAVMSALFIVEGEQHIMKHNAQQIYTFQALVEITKTDSQWGITHCDIGSCVWSSSMSDPMNIMSDGIVFTKWVDCKIYNEECNDWLSKVYEIHKIEEAARVSAAHVTDLKKCLNYVLAMSPEIKDNRTRIGVRSNIILYLTQLQSIMTDTLEAKVKAFQDGLALRKVTAQSMLRTDIEPTITFIDV